MHLYSQLNRRFDEALSRNLPQNGGTVSDAWVDRYLCQVSIPSQDTCLSQ